MEENEIKSISCNNALAPFLRNQYFYGKLLTVRDFENEQSYFIKKQRLINKHIHGEGVVCGLTVEKVKENKIKIKSGIALDCCGREIIVPDDEIIDLSGKDNSVYWVTISYSECGKEQVAAAINANSCEENCCFSRIEEGYKIEVFDEKPEVCSSFQEDNLCKSWKSLEFEEEGSGFQANPNPHPNPYPLDPGFSVNTGVMENIIPRKIHTVSQNSPEEFVKKYQGVCPSEMDKNKPLILAKITINDKAMVALTIDNALINEKGFDKKLVHTNPKLFELLKCSGKDEEDLTKITAINWEHDKEYIYDLVDESTAIRGSNNTITLGNNILDDYEDYAYIEIMILEGTGSHQSRKITDYDTENKVATVDENWSHGIPDKTSKYILMDNQLRKFLEISRRLQFVFNRSINKKTINNKTLNVTAKPYISGQEIPLFGNMQLSLLNFDMPICFGTYSPEDEQNQVSFSLFICDQPEIDTGKRVKQNTFNMMVGLQYLQDGLMQNSLIQNISKIVQLLLEGSEFIGFRINIQLKGDFVLGENEKSLDANHLKGECPTGDGSSGGTFESWIDFKIDTNLLNKFGKIMQYFRANISTYSVEKIVAHTNLSIETTQLIFDAMVKNHVIYYNKKEEKYYPLPDPRKIMVVYDTKTNYLKAEAEKLSKGLKEKGVSVTLKSVSDFTDEDKENHEIILLRGNIVDSNTPTKFSDISSKVKWDKSEGEIEIVHKTDRVGSPVFVIGGKNEASVKTAVENYVKRYSTSQ